MILLYKIISKNFSLDSAKKLLTDKAHGKYNDYEMNNDLESINANCPFPKKNEPPLVATAPTGYTLSHPL